MTLRHKPTDSVAVEDLEALVAAGIPEGKDLDYKRELPGTSDGEKREFLGDVCALANAGGGDLIFGMDESGGVASAVSGVEIPDPDSEILRLESIILSGLEPRLPGIRSRTIGLQDGRCVLLVRVPRSFDRPHAASHGGRLRFISRNSRGKYDMDVAEIRNMAVGSEALAERLRAFRSARLATMKAGEGPVILTGKGLMALHVLPLSAFDSPAPAQVALSVVERDHWSRLKPIGMSGDAPRYNFDGLVRVSGQAAGSPSSYAQLFRSGAVELADTYTLDDRPNGTSSTIPSVAFERYLIEALASVLGLQQAIGIEPPILVALSLLGVRGYQMTSSPGRFDDGSPVDRADLVGPELLLDDLESVADDKQAAASFLRPSLDAVWNACGYPRSLNFDQAGRWSERLS